MLSAILLLVSAFCFGAALTASILSRKYKKQLQVKSDYWQTYWYNHFEDIRQTGLTREQMERLHALYDKKNDM